MSGSVNFNGTVGIANTDKVEIQSGGKQVGIENLNPAPKTPAQAAAEIKELLEQLDLDYPTANEVEFEQALDKKPELASDLVSMIVAGGIELVKLWCAPLGIPIEMGKKYYERIKRRHETAKRIKASKQGKQV